MTFEFSSEDADSIREAVLARVGVMQKGEFAWLAARDEHQCPACPAQGLCPLSLV